MVGLMMPLWIVAIPFLLAVGWMIYEATRTVMDWIDPKIKGYLIRRFEKKTGTKWDPEWSEFWDRDTKPLKGPWSKR